jgi:hypothetical protein
MSRPFQAEAALAIPRQRSGYKQFGPDGARRRNEKLPTAASHGRTLRHRIKYWYLILYANSTAVSALRSERDGLCRRVTDVLSSAAVLGGNGIDEYIEPDGPTPAG